MFKKMILLGLVLIFIGASYVYAHSSLVSSEPSDGEEVTSQITAIKMKFNTKIEDVLDVSVQNEDGQSLSPGETSITDDTVVADFDNPLERGTYTVTSKVIGLDGHAVEATFSFVVSEASTEESAEAPDQTSTEESTKETTDTEQSKAASPTSPDSDGEESEDSGLPFGIIAAIIVIALILVVSVIGLLKKNIGK